MRLLGGSLQKRRRCLAVLLCRTLDVLWRPRLQNPGLQFCFWEPRLEWDAATVGYEAWVQRVRWEGRSCGKWDLTWAADTRRAAAIVQVLPTSSWHASRVVGDLFFPTRKGKLHFLDRVVLSLEFHKLKYKHQREKKVLRGCCLVTRVSSWFLTCGKTLNLWKSKGRACPATIFKVFDRYYIVSQHTI